MKFSKNGKYLASAGQDAAVRVWEVCLNRGEARADDDSEQANGDAGVCGSFHTVCKGSDTNEASGSLALMLRTRKQLSPVCKAPTLSLQLYAAMVHNTGPSVLYLHGRQPPFMERVGSL